MSLQGQRLNSENLWTTHPKMNTFRDYTFTPTNALEIEEPPGYDATGITFFKTASGLMMRPSLSFFA